MVLSVVLSVVLASLKMTKAPRNRRFSMVEIRGLEFLLFPTRYIKSVTFSTMNRAFSKFCCLEISSLKYLLPHF